MLLPIRQMLSDGRPPVTARHGQKVRDALAVMVEHDFSQLPVVDSDGRLSGLFSERSLTRRLCNFQDRVKIMDLAVEHCSSDAVIVSPDEDVLDLLDKIKVHPAVVVTDSGSHPIGILTYFDVSQFFRDFTEGMALVQDIELTLRQTIQLTLNGDGKSDDALQVAVRSAMKMNRDGEPRSDVNFEELSLGDYINVIVNRNNWKEFEPILEEKALFSAYMDQVRDIRNKLAHFKGKLTETEYNLLLDSRSWVNRRIRPLFALHSAQPTDVQVLSVQMDSQNQSRHDLLAHLRTWLQEHRNRRPLRLTFDQIEGLIGAVLPDSGLRHESWWDNDYVSNPRAEIWLRAGWNVDSVDLVNRAVTFRYSVSNLQQMYFADLLSALKDARPGITNANKAQRYFWYHFSLGRNGFSIGWRFASGDRFRTELRIDSGDYDSTKRSFLALLAQREAIERELGFLLEWDESSENRSCLIYVERRGSVKDAPELLRANSEWAVATVQQMIDVFRPRILELSDGA